MCIEVAIGIILAGLTISTLQVLYPVIDYKIYAVALIIAAFIYKESQSMDG